MKPKQILVTLATSTIVLLAAACSTASAGTTTAPAVQIPEITVKAADYSFEAPAQIEAGLVKVNLVNDSQEPHHAQIVRLNEGVTLEQFQTALQQGESSI
jgi:hypothetical protein